MPKASDPAQSPSKKAITVLVALLVGATTSALSSILRLHTWPPIANPFRDVEWPDLLLGGLLAVTYLAFTRSASKLKDFFRVSKMEEHERRLFSKRLVWGLAAAVPALVLVKLAAHLKWLDHHVGTLWEVLVTLVMILFVFFTTETRARLCLFGIPRKQDMGISKMWWEFVGRYSTVDGLIKAKLLMFLFHADGDEIQIEGTFGQYLNILCASTCIAQREWFATYTFGISEWANINRHAKLLVDALAATHLKRKRIVVRPESEFAAIDESWPIVTETQQSGALLECVATEYLNERGVPAVEDCAIFDDEWVVVGVGLSNAQNIDPDSYPVKIRLLKRARASEFLKVKAFLDTVKPVKQFPERKRRKRNIQSAEKQDECSTPAS
jgi:hypothetical protein